MIIILIVSYITGIVMGVIVGGFLVWRKTEMLKELIFVQHIKLTIIKEGLFVWDEEVGKKYILTPSEMIIIGDSGKSTIKCHGIDDVTFQFLEFSREVRNSL